MTNNVFSRHNYLRANIMKMSACMHNLVLGNYSCHFHYSPISAIFFFNVSAQWLQSAGYLLVFKNQNRLVIMMMMMIIIAPFVHNGFT